MYTQIVKSIVRNYGGYREKDVLSKPHTIERGSTWNNDHKVLDIVSKYAESDGYRNGFQVDLVTMSICG